MRHIATGRYYIAIRSYNTTTGKHIGQNQTSTETTTTTNKINQNKAFDTMCHMRALLGRSVRIFVCVTCFVFWLSQRVVDVVPYVVSFLKVVLVCPIIC